MRRSVFANVRRRLEERYLGELGYGSGRQFINQLVSSLQPGDVLLDIGCGEGQLRQIVSESVSYVGLDRYVGKQDNEYAHWNMRPSILADAHQLPIQSGVCDAVALMHVLEHLPRPDAVFSEIARVLKPGGRLFLDVPFMHQLHHAPHDYMRYTVFALENLSQNAGFEVLEIRPSGGYFRVLSYVLKAAPSMVHGTSIGARSIRLTFAYPLMSLGWLVDKLQYAFDLFDSKQEFTCGYHCIFKKRNDDAGTA